MLLKLEIKQFNLFTKVIWDTFYLNTSIYFHCGRPEIWTLFSFTLTFKSPAVKQLEFLADKTSVTHGRMYRRIATGYQIWKIVGDLRIIFFICEHICTVCNILVASATDVKCPWGHHGKIKLLEFSVKGLQILGVINIRIGSVCNP